MKLYRIAFITPEFPSELPDAGGLSNYLARITKALLEHGHHPEVFVISKYPAKTLDWHGITVHRVNAVSCHHLLIQSINFIAKFFKSRSELQPTFDVLQNALGLAKAFHEHQKKQGFDLVQSADYRASGLFIRCRRGCRHVVRCSSAADLYASHDEDNSLPRRWQIWLELTAIRKASLAYAPSQFLADYFRTIHRQNLKVVRPPGFTEVTVSTSIPLKLPARYLLHFGQIMPRKGTAWLAAALPLAWEQASDLTIVCAGMVHDAYRFTWESAMGPQENRVIWLGALPKSVLYGVLANAEATVLPSLVDNLPNTVIESLMAGIPVIGTKGASIDELVTHGENGLLVRKGDAQKLAAAMVSIWNGTANIKAGFNWLDSPYAAEFAPNRAVDNLLALVNG